MSQFVEVVTQGNTVEIFLNRADKKNALSTQMYNQLSDALTEADQDPAVRVVALKARGSAFCAGNDIADFISGIGKPDAMQGPVRFLDVISSMSTPVVAAVTGPAVGIGATMLLHCDMVVADTAARFQLPFAQLGLVPEGCSSLLLPQLVGHRKAFELLVLGAPFDAQTGQEIGLVNRCCEVGELDSVTTALVDQLAQLAPDAVRQSKALLRYSQKDQIAEVIRHEVEMFGRKLGSEEAAEALQAFMEKRPPDFSRF